MVGIEFVSARIINASLVFVQLGDLVHDFVIDTLFSDEEWQALMWVFVLLLGAGSGP